MLRRLGIVVANVCLASVTCIACSSSSNAGGATSKGSGTSTGTVNGAAFQVLDAESVTSSLPGSGTPPEMELDVVVSNFEGVCGAPSLPAKGATLEIVLLATTLGPGTYSIDNQEMSVYYQALPGSQCITYNFTTASGGGTVDSKATVYDVAMSGSVTITKTDSTGASGSFTATFASGDTLTGDFVAPTCTEQGGVNGC